MAIYPLVVALIALVFGGIVLRQWLTRKRPQQLLWSVSLFMAALAALVYVAFLSTGADLIFRVYYIFGALLNAAYLGMGSLYLVLSRRVANLVLSGLVIVSAFGVALLVVAPLDPTKLHEAQLQGLSGAGVIKQGLWLVLFILHNVFGALTVSGVAVYSAYKVGKQQAPRRFAVANITIAAGVLIVSQAGSGARLGAPSGLFWIITAAGFSVVFVGFLLTAALPIFVGRGRAAQTGEAPPASA